MELGKVRQRFRYDEMENLTSDYMEKQNRHGSSTNIRQLPLYSVLVVVLTGVGLLSLAYLSTEALPEPLHLKDAHLHGEKFIAGRAQSHLEKLTSMGPKPVGSYENEVLAVDFLTREISFIMQRANPNKRISYDLQKSTGSYLLQFQPHGFVNYYSDIQNIIVKLSSSLNSSSSLLINCHFDSVPTSPGGSDDGLNCAVMLEVLEVLSRSNKSLKHNVIFLFNGAEESPLQGSHGFITQHEWANEVKAFINLEACGAGGREVLFQAGPNHPWLVQLYAESVPHPHGVVVAEEIFQSGLIPSDTDFRVFRDYGGIPGLDFAHAMNGYVYHTAYDDLAAIPSGTFQHTGDNLLALVQKLASSEELADTANYADGQAVYYDLFGLFMARYTKNVGSLLNLSTVVLAIFGAWRDVHFLVKVGRPLKIFKLLTLNTGVLVLGWIASVVFVLLVATFLDSINCSMSWFTRTYLIFGLYYCPVLFFSMLFPHMLFRYWTTKKVSLPQEIALQGRLYINAVQFFWAVVLLCGTLVGIKSSFIFMILLLLPSLANIILGFSPWREKSYHWLATFLGSTLIPVLFVLYNTLLTFGLFIPITGRIGPTKNPDAIIGIFATILCILSTSYVTPLIIIVRNAWKCLTSIAVLHVISLAVVIFSPLGFPYSANPVAPTPQRIHIYHVGRMFHEASGHILHKDSGFWLVNLDRHSPDSVKSLIPDIAKAQRVDMTHGKELVCAYPLFSPRVLSICEHNHWIPAVPPVVHSPASLEVKSVTNVSQVVRRLSIRVSGPDHMALVLAPCDGCIILNWSFNADVASSVISLGEQQIYYITYAHGLSAQPWNFWIELQVPHQELSHSLDIGVSAQYINEKLSEHFVKFIKMYPDWAHVTAWTATYTAWKI